MEEEISRVKSCIEKIKEKVLPLQDIDINISCYTSVHMHLAGMYFFLKKLKQAFYHLSESHGALMRRYLVIQELSKEGCFGIKNVPPSLNWKYLSTRSEFAKDEEVGLFKRLSEMPPEWTIVQLSRIPQNEEHLVSSESYPKLKEMFVSRVQCGQNPDEILVDYTDLPVLKVDVMCKIKEASDLLRNRGLTHAIIKSRKKASKTIEEVVSTLDDDMFMDWKCIFLGKLQDVCLEKNIRKTIDDFLDNHKIELPPMIKGLFYLIAEGIFFYEPPTVKSSIRKHLASQTIKIQDSFLKEILNLKEKMVGLKTAKRHPVILIVEDALDIVPWESMPILKEQAATRVPSVHFLYALFKAHQPYIVNGLREISEGKINCYIVNPDSDLTTSEKRLKPFFEARLPNWKGIVGEKPPPKELLELVSSSNTYLYCGHGSGGHLMNGEDVKKLNLTNSIQILFGCQSAALTFLGGRVPMMGYMLNYCIAGSPCSLGMLYTIMSSDADEMTEKLTNIWLPGTPINPATLKPIESNVIHEAELLRVLPKVRSVCTLPSNALAFIARGLPVKIVSSESH